MTLVADPRAARDESGGGRAASVAERPAFGPQITDAGVLFRLWAPKCDAVQLELAGRAELLPMTAESGGWHRALVADAGPGTRYRFVLPDGLRVPDPASRYQPEDVHGPSEVTEPGAFAWTDSGWAGRPWTEAVIYELHVGAFTREGTFRAAAERLDHLAALGVTAIELMPIADFPGARNWGYDGTLLYAPDSAYGRPEDLKALVDAAHTRGLMVFLDVVYNHFGPDGNYLPVYAPIFTDKHKTPWGAAINYDDQGSDAVREFVLQNAEYWIREFHLDGLRLDAVHAIKDASRPHLLDALSARARAAAPHRHVHLILENEENEARRLERGPDGAPRAFTAQWNDDMHHVLHTAATGEQAGYYIEYAGDREKLGRSIAEGFAFQGEMMTYRGEPRGEPSGHLPPSAFVSFLQNHDQIGNRAIGDRITATTPRDAVRAVASIYLLAPQIPMLFMGEEWAAAQPFPFFCDFGPELANAVREGRRAEFARFPEFQDPAARDRIPDPTQPETFLSAKLDWSALERAPHREWLDWYRAILRVRRDKVVPLLDERSSGGSYELTGQGGLHAEWQLRGGARLRLAAHLGSGAAGEPVPAEPGFEPIWLEGGGGPDRMPPWSVRWSLRRGG
ncbi:malto-oligosyltrehalose trehalohydrolase [Enterovirga sp.]|uniref:malto-oligosyltrehalose trehalohydrolase n=1 Tax=Enterovirga sp. TaxID=2026350 RepID=UPI002635988A|nr:malto-oligosyltrehalose trehalohydrolase [Enterovirga sp.]MDB5591217.1 treZ [Enterovirga sp.]